MFKSFFLLLVPLWMSLIACGGRCTEGATNACACVGGMTGVQTCTSHATFGPCDCGPADVAAGGAVPESAPTAVVEPVVRRVVSATVGGDHACAALDDGALYCWGGNRNGQLGTDSTVDQLLPTRVLYGRSVAVVAAGWDSTCALTRTGAALCWGSNARAEIGNGSGGPVAGDVRHPWQLEGINDAVQISTASGSCIVRASGQLVCWGSPGHLRDLIRAPQTDTAAGSDVVHVVGGSHHRCLIRHGGGVACIGDNTLRQIGDGTEDDRYQYVDISGLEHATSIISGGDHTCALHEDGHVSCWGYNGHGRLGLGNEERVRSPGVVVGLTDAVAIAAANATTCAARSDGSVVCWGSTTEGLIPNATGNVYTPTIVTGLANVLSFASQYGGSTMCAIHRDGHLSCWGRNDRGEAGTGTAGDVAAPTRVPIPGTSGGT